MLRSERPLVLVEATTQFRSMVTGAVIDPAWTQFSFPTGWHYDVLRGLDSLRRAGVEPDQRITDAIELVARERMTPA